MLLVRYFTAKHRRIAEFIEGQSAKQHVRRDTGTGAIPCLTPIAATSTILVEKATCTPTSTQTAPLSICWSEVGVGVTAINLARARRGTSGSRNLLNFHIRLLDRGQIRGGGSELISEDGCLRQTAKSVGNSLAPVS